MNKDNLLNYKGFEYKTYEWDNVPHIMPRLAFHLEAYIKGLVKLCSEYDERETVQELRSEMERRFTDGQEADQNQRKVDIEEKEGIRAATDGLQAKIDENFDAFKEY